MKEAENELLNWCDQIFDYHLPRWQELPELDLYMDQVVTLIEKYLMVLSGSGRGRIITPAMINNYVKLKLMPAPVKKRYARIHLAYLIAITILKQVITIQEVKNGIVYQEELLGTREAFNTFCEEQELALRKIASALKQTELVLFENQMKIENVAMKMSTLAFASKILAEKTIYLQKTEISVEGKVK